MNRITLSIAIPISAVLCVLQSTVVSAQQSPNNEAPIFQSERVGSYRTREDRREAGLGTQLTDWLTFSGLIEVESLREGTEFDVVLSDHMDFSTDPAVQAAFDLSLFDIAEAEIIFEYTEDSHEPIMDELIIAGDIGDFGFNVGRYYAPFGLYYSNFINGPMVEFAETRRDMLQIDYDFEDRIEYSVFVFDGVTRELGSSSNDVGWGLLLMRCFWMEGSMWVQGISRISRNQMRNTFVRKIIFSKIKLGHGAPMQFMRQIVGLFLLRLYRLQIPFENSKDRQTNRKHGIWSRLTS